jgi:hypothetical protein
VSVHLGGAVNGSFYLAGRNSKPEIGRAGAPPRNPYSASTVRATRYAGTGPLNVAFRQRITTEDGKPPVETSATPSILRQGGPYTLLACDNDITLGDAEISSLVKPVFYQDNLNTLYLEPDLTERTIEEWQEWVTRTPQPEPEWDRPDWWDSIFVSAAVPSPKDGIRVDPGRPVRQLGVGDESLVAVKPRPDWVVNPQTGVLFGGELIGPGGRAGVDVLTSLDADGVLALGGSPVHIQAGSGIATDRAMVTADHDGLRRAGLNAATTGLNVVGGSGLNAALARNLAGLARAGALTQGRIEG